MTATGQACHVAPLRWPGRDRLRAVETLSCIALLDADRRLRSPAALRRCHRLGPGRHPSRPAPQRPGRRRGRARRCCSAPGSACCPRRAACTSPDRDDRRGRRSARRLDQRRATASRGTRRASARSTRDGPRAALVVEPRDGRAVRGHARWRGDARRRADRALGRDPPRYVGRRACRATRPAASAGSSTGRSVPSPSTCAPSRAVGSTRYVDCSRERARPVGLPRRHARLPRGRCGRRSTPSTVTSSCSSTRRGARRSPPPRQLLLGESLAARRSFD